MRLIRLGVVLSSAAVAAAQPCLDPAFDRPVYPAGVGPTGVAVGDFNGDGVLDYVTVTRTNPAIHVYLGLGPGPAGLRFYLAASHNIPSGGDLHAGDLNGDGHLDLVVAESRNLRVYWGDGDAGFTLGPRRSAWAPVSQSFLADVGADGDLDIIWVESPNIFMDVNDGEGNFTQLPVSGGQWLAITDLNGDGLPDAVVGAYRSGDTALVRVHLGTPEGPFPEPTDYDTGIERPAWIVATDLDADGAVDVLVAEEILPDEIVYVLYGDGTGKLAAPVDTGMRLSVTIDSHTDAHTAELNGDGRNDLIWVDSGLDVMEVHLTSAAGGLAAARYETGDEPQRPAVTDFDADGDPDVLVPCALDRNVMILVNPGDGRFPPDPLLSWGHYATDVIARDFDRDGAVDIVQSTTAGVQLTSGRAGGGFDLPEAMATPGRGSVTGQFTGDSATDVVGLNGSAIYVTHGDLTEPFATSTYLISPRPRACCNVPLVADLDLDGWDDIILIGEGDPAVVHFGGQEPFQRHVILPYELAVGSLAADIIGTDHPDLVTFLAETVEIREGLGDGAFAAPRQIEAPWPVGAAQVGDVTGDGATDLLLLAESVGELAVLRARAGGGFDPPMISPSGLDGHDLVELADLDGDGDLDAACVHDGAPARLVVMLNGGEGFFSVGPSMDVEGEFRQLLLTHVASREALVVATRMHAWILLLDPAQELQTERLLPLVAGWLLIGDVDGDGRDDFVTMRGFSPSFPINTVVYRGNEARIVNAPEIIHATEAAPAVAAADFDGDGWDDLVATSPDTGDVTVKWNVAGRFERGDRLAAGAEHIFAADVTGDGAGDIVSIGAATARIYRNDGAGGFTPGAPLDLSFAPAGAAAEHNPGGAADIAVFGAASVAVLRGDSAGSLSLGYERPFADRPRAVAIADINGDGRGDLLVGAEIDNLFILFGDGAGGFADPAIITIGRSPRDIMPIDLDADGDVDLVSADMEGDSLTILLNDGDGGFDQARFHAEAPVAVDASDVNHDGLSDLIYAGISIPTTFPENRLSRQFGIVHGVCPLSACRVDLDGDGELTFFDFLAFQDLFAGGDPRADFDGDGALTFFDFLAFQNEFAAGCP